MDNNCIFCKIAGGDILSCTVFEDDDFRVILDIEPAQRGHMLILPKKHYDDITVMPESLSSKIMPLASKLGRVCKKVLKAKGFNIVVNTGREAGQTVFHCHTHIIPRYDNGAKILTWEHIDTNMEELKKICEEIKNTDVE